MWSEAATQPQHVGRLTDFAATAEITICCSVHPLQGPAHTSNRAFIDHEVLYWLMIGCVVDRKLSLSSAASGSCHLLCSFTTLCDAVMRALQMIWQYL